jgi:hypothetical protein
MKKDARTHLSPYTNLCRAVSRMPSGPGCCQSLRSCRGRHPKGSQAEELQRDAPVQCLKTVVVVADGAVAGTGERRGCLGLGQEEGGGQRQLLQQLEHLWRPWKEGWRDGAMGKRRWREEMKRNGT